MHVLQDGRCCAFPYLEHTNTRPEDKKKNLAKNPRWLLKGSQDQSPQNDRFPSWLPTPPELRSARQCVPERCQCFGLVHESLVRQWGQGFQCALPDSSRVFMSLNSTSQSLSLCFKFWRRPYHTSVSAD